MSSYEYFLENVSITHNSNVLTIPNDATLLGVVPGSQLFIEGYTLPETIEEVDIAGGLITISRNWVHDDLDNATVKITPVGTVAALLSGMSLNQAAFESAQASVSTLSNSLTSLTEQTSSAFSELRDNVTSGELTLSGDGIDANLLVDNDQHGYVQGLLDRCAAENKTLVIDFPVWVDTDTHGPLIAKCSMRFTGSGCFKVKVLNSTLLRFENPNEPIEVDLNSVGGLTEHSYQITGLPAPEPGDLVVINSSEILIERLNNTTYPFYRKRETCVVADNDGRLSVPVAENYDIDQIEYIHLYRNAPLITVTGLRVESVNGPLSCNVDGIIEVSHVYLKHTNTQFKNIRNDYSCWKNTESVVWNIEPVITGEWDNSIGYGITNFSTAFSEFRGCIITRCRHAVAGRHDKNTVALSGIYDKDFDTHYGYNLRISNCVINGTVSFAGRNADITKNRFYITDETGVFTERTDSPETRGSVIFDDNDIYANIEVSGGRIFLMVFGAQYSHAFERELAKPDYVSCRSNRLHNLSAYYTIKCVSHLQSSGYNYQPFGLIYIENLQQIGTNNKVEILSNFTKFDGQVWSRNTVIKVRDMPAAVIRLINNQALGTQDGGFEFQLFNIAQLYFRCDLSGVVKGQIINSGVYQLSNDTQGTIKPAYGVLQMVNNTYHYSDKTISQDWQHQLRGRFPVTLPKDEVIQLQLAQQEFGYLKVLANNATKYCGDIIFNQSLAETRVASVQPDVPGIMALNDTVLDGSSGQDDTVTVSISGNSLFIENRISSAEATSYFLCEFSVNGD